MNKIYLKLFVGIIVGLWIIYFLQMMFNNSTFINTSYNDCKCGGKRCKCGKPSGCGCEGFTSSFRPYIRKLNQTYDNLISNYGPNTITHKLKKWNIYG